MKSSLALAVSAALLMTAGCAEERIPADEADLWEAAENPTSTPSTGSTASSGNPASPTPAAEPAPEGAVAQVKGSAFKIDENDAPAEGDEFTRPHYFEAFAPVELTAPATLMETDIEGQNSNGAVPVIGLFVMGEDGTTQFGNNGRPIDGKQLLKDKVDLQPGKYRLRMTYFKDTVGEVRPRITLRTITFR